MYERVNFLSFHSFKYKLGIQYFFFFSQFLSLFFIHAFHTLILQHIFQSSQNTHNL